MRPKLQNIGEKWFILSFDLRVFIEKGTILIKKDIALRRCISSHCSQKKTPLQSDVFFGVPGRTRTEDIQNHNQ